MPRVSYYTLPNFVSEYYPHPENPDMKDQDIVGEALSSVLPKYERFWFQIHHLLELNLILLVPLLSSAVASYDGKLVGNCALADTYCYLSNLNKIGEG